MPDSPGGAGDPVLRLELPYIDCADAFACWAEDPHTVWLDSNTPVSERSRFSFLGVEPFEVLGGSNAFAALTDAMARYASPGAAQAVPFAGGAAGFIGYEQGAVLERVPCHAPVPGMPAFAIALYDVVITFDHAMQCAWLISSGLPESEWECRRARARARADSVLQRLNARRARARTPVRLCWRAETSRAAHEDRIARTIGLIAAGDIYQANITAAFRAGRPAGMGAADLYLALRAKNPVPFGAYVAAGGGSAVASVSPERFLSVSAVGDIEARPIKGTRPRGADSAGDAMLQRELSDSGKDAAENLMIVDLLRHDISRVAEIGSVHVPELARLESFAHVHHLVSSVKAVLAPGKSAIDLLRAAFPPGSITGAPKMRAQQIIHALEPTARGPYCGTVFWLGWDGAMDSSVAIRTASVTPGHVTIQAGGGVVADSDPAAEYEEMLVKARPMLRALGDWAE